MDSFPSRCSVIVVGAGISGISAAKVLAESGVEELLILEASGRIGGRIKKERFGGVPVEIGAGWITGVGGREPNPVWELAGDSALRTCLSDYSNVHHNIYDRSGTIFPGRVASESYEKAVKSAIQRLSKEEAIGTAAAGASGDPCDPQPLLTPKTPIELAIDFVLHDFEMAEVEPISTYKEMGEMEFLVADERGYEHLVFQMAQKFLRVSEGKIMDRRLQLNMVVREVKHSRNGVTVVTEDGQAFEADYAILSVSIGVLKSDLISFRPPLPRWKADAIDRCEVTIYTKIFLKFPYRFWPPGSGKEFFIYAHEQRGYYTFWQNLERVYPDSNILVVTLTNDQSKRVEAQADEETLKEAMEVLRDMFGSEIPDASDILVPRWWNDRFQRGSYSNYPIVCDHRTASEMRAPVGRVCFTGEHTSVQFNGYVHGGYLSGVDSGRALVEEMRKEKESKSFVVGGLHKCDIPWHPFLGSKLGIPEAIL